MSLYEDRLRGLAESTVVGASWDPTLHPRARNGRFIELGGWVRGLFKIEGHKNWQMQNGRVTGVSANPHNPADPIVHVMTKLGEVSSPASKVIEAAKPKASITRLPLIQEHVKDIDKRFEKVETVQEAIARVNEAAGSLSTTDPTERMRGLDKIMGGVRGTALSTAVQQNKRGKSGDEWDPVRVAQHEKMWDAFKAKVDAAGIPKEHKALALGGLPGAGKSTSLRPGGPAGRLGVIGWEPNTDVPDGATHVVMNPDIIKELMIDQGLLPDGVSPLIKPLEQVSFIHAESNFLTALFFDRLADEGYNVVYDTTMANVPHVKKNLGPLRDAGYSFDGLYVHIPREESRISTAQRYLADWQSPRGGRFVPSEAGSNDNRNVFRQMTPWFDDWLVIDNTGVSKGQPRGTVTAEGQGEDPLLERMRQAEAARRAAREAQRAEEKESGGEFTQGDFLAELNRAMRSSASDAIEDPITESAFLRMCRQVPGNGLAPENLVSKVQRREVFVQDPVDLDADEDDYLVASQIVHEFQALGWDQHIDGLAAAIAGSRDDGVTMSKYIAEE